MIPPDSAVVAPDTGVMLDVWDRATVRPMAERGPFLLDQLGLTPAGVAAADLTVGTCDLLLVDLRRRLFGPTVEAVTTCAGCDAELECRIDIDELWPRRAEPGDIHGAGPILDIEIAGEHFSCRLPVNRDLVELSRTVSARRPTRFAECCVLAGPWEHREPDIPGVERSLSDRSDQDRPIGGSAAPVIDDETIAELATALAALDPGAATFVELRCYCGATDVVEMDIRSFLWAELSAWAERTLTEIHELAATYGWRESDVLALTPRRRRAYLQRCGC
jgi:hypothetical protein